MSSDYKKQTIIDAAERLGLDVQNVYISCTHKGRHAVATLDRNGDYSIWAGGECVWSQWLGEDA